MKENTYYFDHDYNAQHDPKVEKMIFSFDIKGEDGNSAYGVFWRIVEKLAQEPLHMLKTEYEILAYNFRKKVEFIKSVVEDFGLFIIDNGWFWSERLNTHFEKRGLLSERGRKGGIKKAENEKVKDSKILAQAELSSSPAVAQVELSTSIKGKEKKENEIKEDKIKPNNLDIEKVEICETPFFENSSENTPDQIKEQKKLNKLKHMKTHNYFQNEYFCELWNKYCDFRGKEYTADAKIMGLNKLFRYSLDESIDSIENAIHGCWKSFYPKKLNDNKPKFITKQDRMKLATQQSREIKKQEMQNEKNTIFYDLVENREEIKKLPE